MGMGGWEGKRVSINLFPVCPVGSVGRGLPVWRMLDGWVSIMHHLVGDLGFRQLEDHHGTAQHQREKAQGESFPRFQGDQGKG